MVSGEPRADVAAWLGEAVPAGCHPGIHPQAARMAKKSELQIPPGDLNSPRGLEQGLAAHSGQICEQAPGQAPRVTAGHRAGSRGTARHQLSSAPSASGLHNALGSEQHQHSQFLCLW